MKSYIDQYLSCYKKMKYTIRRMTLRDYDAVVSLWRNVPGIGLDSDCDSRQGIARYLRRNPGLSFVACIDGMIVGAVLSGHDGRRGYLHHLAVRSAYRRIGIGKGLVSHCLRSLKKQGILKCNIFLIRSNARGRSFWEHNGWNLRRDLGMLQKMTDTIPLSRYYITERRRSHGCIC
jgi:putative acetyltransferase